MKTIGIAGAHRTGKTTLAKTIAAQLNIPFVQTTTSAVFKQHGLDPAQVMDFNTRLTIQQHVAEAAQQSWQVTQGNFITDRTPLDFMAYTLADIQGKTSVNFKQLENYLTNCFTLTNQFFNHIIIIQPGIPLVYEEGKAALNQSYIEHLNSLVLGLSHDERIDCSVSIIKRKMTSLEARLTKILSIIHKDGLQ